MAVVALVQQHAGPDPGENLRRGLEAIDTAAGRGADIVAFADLRDRRPDLYAEWLVRS